MTDREKLIAELRELAGRMPPICDRDRPETILIFDTPVTVHCKPFEQFQDVLRRAADALADDGVTVQELDGCEYCKEDSEGFRRMFGAFSLVNPFHGKTWQIHAGKCRPREINFCPMCGRRLPQPPKGE